MRWLVMLITTGLFAPFESPGVLLTTLHLGPSSPSTSEPADPSRSVSLLAPWEPERYDAKALADALDRRLTYPYSLRVGRPRHIWHCRNAPSGCRARVEAFAHLFVNAGKQTGVSPWLLAAMAMKESGLNPLAEGKGGERGILQIHPRRKEASGLAIFKDGKRCKKDPDPCQEEVVMLAAQILRDAIERCGSTAGGLRAYNSGRCNGATSYDRRVERELLRLYALAEEIARS